MSARMHKLPAPSPSTLDFEEDSFLDDDARMATFDPDDISGNKENEPMYSRGINRNTRDSHDLSFPARQITRDSLVTNMLSSLDKFSLGQINTPMGPMFEDDDDYARSMSISTNPRTTKNRTNNSGNVPSHGYSYSSDLDGADEVASRVSSQFSRERRSNSGSGFQSSLARLGSLREKSRSGHPRRPLHSRGGKTSKSSSSNSIDAGYAQGATTQRWAHGAGGRSSSFDYGTRPALNSPTSANGPWNGEYNNSFLVDDYEAAPTPTIPVGPRRSTMTSSSAAVASQFPTSPIAPSMTDPEITPADWKRSTQSRSGLRSRGGTSVKSSTQANFNHPHDIPPLPPMDLDSAPSPNIGYEKPNEATRATPAPPQPKVERPGFFRRVFGASRIIPSSSTQTAPETVEQTMTKTQQPAKPGSAPPSRDSQQLPRVIQKKSSFFRRRKKSFDEPPAPPVPVPPVEPLPADTSLTAELSVPKQGPSPVSSLREVMIPYLKDDYDARAASPAPQSDAVSPGYKTEKEEVKRKTRGFSPDYEPSPNATIRTVKSQSALNIRASGSSFARWQEPELPNKKPPKVPDATFFHDSSDDEKPRELSRLRSSRQHSGKSSPATGSRDNLTASIIREEQLGSGGRSPKSGDFSNSLATPGSASDIERLRTSLTVPTDVSQGSKRRSMSSESRLRSAASLPSVRVDHADIRTKFSGSPLDEPDITVGEPTEDDRQKARGIFDGSEEFIQKEKAASWMGEEGLVRQRTLRAYMALYNFTDQSVLSALRQVCTRLVFRAETQQVDRILVAFSNRWCECNANHGFKTMGM